MMFKIRLATTQDAKAIQELYTPYVLHSVATLEDTVPSVSEIELRINDVLSESAWLVGTVEGRIVAYAYASSHRSRAGYRWNREVSVYVNKSYHRKKIGYVLYKILFAIVQQQGFSNVLAGVVIPNKPSVKLHTALGFELVGTYKGIGFKFGEYHDTQWFQKKLNNRVPTSILPLTEFINTKSWQQTIVAAEQLVKL